MFLSLDHVRRVSVDTREDDRNSGEKFIPVSGHEIQSRVIQNEDKIELSSLIFVFQILLDEQQMFRAGKSVGVQMFNGEDQEGIGLLEGGKDSGKLIIRPIFALVISIQNKDLRQGGFTSPGHGRATRAAVGHDYNGYPDEYFQAPGATC